MNGSILAIEILIIGIVVWIVTTPFIYADSTHALPGSESEWLTSYAYVAFETLHTEGHIAMWDPWLASGEPLIDNPFSFVINPISIGPSLIYGAILGLHISVILTALVAGLGGWALGRVMGFGPPARIFLALLCIGKGNMPGMIGAGYFQLGVAQAYFPWILAGTIGILRFPDRRWPIVFTALAFALLFWAGNLWYMLPMLMLVGLLTIAGVIRVNHVVNRRRINVNWPALRRMALCAVLTAGLCAVTLLPIWINRDRIGGHPSQMDDGPGMDPLQVIGAYFNGDPATAPGPWQFYFTFIMPIWLVQQRGNNETDVPYPQPFSHKRLEGVMAFKR